LQTHYDLRFLETIEQWGCIRKINNPQDFFNSIAPRFWHPVTGLLDGETFQYFEDLEVYFEILDLKMCTVSFVRILIEDETVSLHGSIIKNPSIVYKAWYYILNSFLLKSDLKILKSRVIAENLKALIFLFSSGFQITYIQEIRQYSIIHLELNNEHFINSKIAHLHRGSIYPKIKNTTLLNKSISEVYNFIPEEIIARNVKYLSENTRVIFDEYLWFYCLFETFENFHEITVYFINEDKKTKFYTSSKESYSYFLFSSLSKSILQLVNYPFLLQISKTRYNLAPLYYNFKYLGSSQKFLIFNSNN
jgi:hypothetical protein